MAHHADLTSPPMPTARQTPLIAAPSRARTTPTAAPGRGQRLARTGLWAGMVGPVLFALVFSIDGALKPGYTAMAQAVSYLEVGSYGWVQMANFAVFAVLLVGFGYGFTHAMRPIMARRPLWTAGYLGVSAAGYLTAAVFPPAAFGQSQTDLIPTLHTVAFEMCFFGLDLACVTAGLSLIRTAGWRRYGGYSVLTGIVLLAPPLGTCTR